MSFKARTIPAFERHAKPLLKKYPSLRDELKALVLDLMERPEQGTPLGMGCYKIRIAIASKGKGRSGRTPPERFGDGARGAGGYLCLRR